MLLTGDQHHHPPLRKDTVSTLVTSDPPASPWIAAGDHRSSRAPTSLVPPILKFKHDKWDPLSASLSFLNEALSENAFCQIRFLFGLA